MLNKPIDIFIIINAIMYYNTWQGNAVIWSYVGMDIRSALGQNIKTLRTAAGMSQEELAAKMDVDQAYISRLEAGQKNPTVLTIWHIAQALHTTPSGLLDENGGKPDTVK